MKSSQMFYSIYIFELSTNTLNSIQQNGYFYLIDLLNTITILSKSLEDCFFFIQSEVFPSRKPLFSKMLNVHKFWAVRNPICTHCIECTQFMNENRSVNLVGLNTCLKSKRYSEASRMT